MEVLVHFGITVPKALQYFQGITWQYLHTGVKKPN